MMNQYRDGTRSLRDTRGYDRSPYRRPMMGRMNPPAAPFGRVSNPGSGCGCGLSRDSAALRERRAPEPANACRLPEDGSGARQCPAVPAAACGCHGTHTDRKLLDRIRAVDFALYEVVLYLDVYPHSCDALETYRKLRAQREELHREYESIHGPLTAFGNQSEDSWDWISSPFPWEYHAD